MTESRSSTTDLPGESDKDERPISSIQNAGPASPVTGSATTSPAGPEGGVRSRFTVAAAVIAVLLVVGAVALVVNRETARQPAPATGPASATAPPAGQPSALTALAPFLSAAATLDRQLKDAAAAINSSGPPWDTVSNDVASKVQAADPTPVAQAIPAGLPPDLLRSVILVYSDLTSRLYAMGSFYEAHAAGPHFPKTAELLAQLGNGHAAAARFDDDLAATQSLAAATAPISAQPSNSRQAAEVLLLVQFVDSRNGGCDGHGGVIVPKLPAIVWTPTPGDPSADGTIASAGFTADLNADGTWNVSIIAC